MKVVLIILAIVFVGGFVTIAADPFGAQQQAQQSTDPLNTINQQYQPTVAALTNQLRSEPESYTVLVTLGNTYFDWAISMQQAAQQGQNVPAGSDQPLWISAKDAYRRAVALQDDDPPVLVDYAITLHYTGETPVAIEMAERALEAEPEFAPAYFNLGVFHAAQGDNAQAFAAFERSIELDPDGQQTNRDYAVQQVEALRSQAGTTPSEPTTPAP
jgi:tetratricopeptide (TPR) repeat protein